jgi:predicted  nucleic acid-binding Zn-ribbon protein
VEQELRTVFEAQQIDLEISEFEKKAVSGPKKLEELDSEIDNLNDKVARQATIIEELEKERRKKEKDLEMEKEKIKKFESRLYEVKTNKEYQALLKEIESAKGINDKTEEEILVLMEKGEELKKDHEAAAKELVKLESEYGAERKRLEDELRSIDAVISGLKANRDSLLDLVDEDLKATYSTLIERRDGLAVVNVRNGVCLGCFMNIPPQLFIEATKNRQVILCPSCNRIFYFIDDE